MSGIEVITGLNKLSLHQCETLAQDVGFDSLEFDLVGPRGRKSCKWLDAYFGFFTMEGVDGFISSKDFTYAHDLHCENLRFPRDSDRSGEAGETGTGSTEGESAGRKASPKEPYHDQ